jgi:hypothetical protein
MGHQQQGVQLERDLRWVDVTGDLAGPSGVPAAGAAGASPFLWGTEHGLRALLGRGLDYLQLRQRRCSFRFRSPQQFVDVFRASYGPLVRAFEAVGDDRRAALEADLLLDLVRRRNRLDDAAVSVAGTYLEAIGTRR